MTTGHAMPSATFSKAGPRVIAVALLVLTISPFARAADTVDWPAVNAAMTAIERSRLDRKNIEAAAYTVTTDLCYAFEFRARHDQNLVNPNPITEAIQIHREWDQDAKLQRAYAQWREMDFKAYRAILQDETAYLSARSAYSKTLLETVDFSRAAHDCATRLQASPKEIEEKLRYEIIRNERVKSGSTAATASAIAFSAIFRGVSFGWRLAMKTTLMKKAAEGFASSSYALTKTVARYPKTARVLQTSAPVTLVSAAVGLPLLEASLRASEEQAAVINALSALTTTPALWDQWEMRRELMNRFFNDLKTLRARSAKVGHLDCSEPQLCERTTDALNLFARGRGDLETLLKQTESDLKAEADRQHVKDFETWLAGVVQTPSASTPDVLERAQFALAAHIVLDLLDTAKR